MSDRTELPGWRRRQIRERFPLDPPSTIDLGDPLVDAIWCKAQRKAFCLLCRRHATVPDPMALESDTRCTHCGQRLDHVTQPPSQGACQ